MSKKLIFVSSMFIYLTSCSSSKQFIPERSVEIEKMDRNNYSVTEQVSAEAEATTFWFLFIPFGGKSKEKLYEKAYNEAVKKIPNCDGILTPRAEYSKKAVPLLIFSTVTKKVTVTGRGFRIKTDSELKKEKGN